MTAPDLQAKAVEAGIVEIIEERDIARRTLAAWEIRIRDLTVARDEAKKAATEIAELNAEQQGKIDWLCDRCNVHEAKITELEGKLTAAEKAIVFTRELMADQLGDRDRTISALSAGMEAWLHLHAEQRRR